MMSSVETRLDGSTLIARVPMRFQRRGGRKRIVAPDGSAIVPTSRQRPDGTLLKALARAWRWQRMLDEGVFTSVSEIGDAENISKSYVSRILRLALLAPNIIEAILAARPDQPLMLEGLERQLLAMERAAAHGSDHAGEDDAAKVWTPRPSAPAGVRTSVGGEER